MAPPAPLAAAWERSELRAWARSCRLLSPVFTARDLEDTLRAAQGASCEDDVKAKVAARAFPDERYVAAARSLDLDGFQQGVSAMPGPLLSSPVVQLVTSEAWASAARSVFESNAQPGRFCSPLTPESLGVPLGALLACTRELGLECTASVVALSFRRSTWALRTTGTERHVGLCYDEFVEALCRCACDGAGDSISEAVARLQELGEHMGAPGPAAIPPVQRPVRADRPLTPRKRSNSDLAKWPHIAHDDLQTLGGELDRLLAQRPILATDVREVLRRLGPWGDRLAEEDVFVKQRLLPSLRTVIEAFLEQRDQDAAGVVLDALVSLVAPWSEHDAGTALAAVIPAQPELASWLVEQCLSRWPRPEGGPANVLVAAQFLVRLADGGAHPCACAVADALAAHAALKGTVCARLASAMLESGHDAEDRTVAALCLGAAIRSSDCSPFLAAAAARELERTLESGSVDLRVCVWAMRACGRPGICRLLRIVSASRSSPRFSAKAREFACWALALGRRDLETPTIVLRAQRRGVGALPSYQVYLERAGRVSRLARCDGVRLGNMGNPQRLLVFAAVEEVLDRVRSAVHGICRACRDWCTRTDRGAEGAAPWLLGASASCRCLMSDSADAEPLAGPELDALQDPALFPRSAGALAKAVSCDPEPDVCQSAALSLGRLLGRARSHEFLFQKAILGPLLGACEHPHPGVRESAFAALGSLASRFAMILHDDLYQGELGAFRFVDATIGLAERALREDRIWKVRLEAVICLGKFGGLGADRAAPAVEDAMRRGTMRHRAAGAALANMGQAGLDALVDLVRAGARQGPAGPSCRSRVAAAQGLGCLGGTRHAERLRRAVAALYAGATQCVGPVRAESVAALGKVARGARASGLAEAVPKLSERTLEPFLLGALGDSSLGCARAAAEALAGLQPGGELLLVQSLHDPSQRARVAALHGLGCCGPSALRLVLSHAVRDEVGKEELDAACQAIELGMGRQAVEAHVAGLDEAQRQLVRDLVLRLGARTRRFELQGALQGALDLAGPLSS